ncbi:MAG TPA: dihydroneopterin aldolase [Thiobacillaceae bacterium]|nr:dihydroneopterin aldolase [Thiobacillaceae bacterium]HNA81494.1 dihydroneopterin aldolase [Thiobacillaceae bacterium]HNF89628.1 dihydroneopterin aldolase [Thiobacillaceae bacterium]HNH89604.1 dihydroneopterin aldolase [Thiobacillaceae bacterium]HNI06658.1 dihydroneopterin aldolase [Thiobacillaceae bacterium]
MDILFLRDFRLEMIIGLYEWERKAPQPVMLDLEIGLYDHKAGHTDQIGDTIHYGEVAARIQEVVSTREIRLVETLGEIIADIVRNEFGAPWVRVAVRKIAILRGVKELGIIVERGSRL